MTYAEPAELAWALHKSKLTEDEELIAERCLEAASAEVDAWIDWPDEPTPDESWTSAEAALVNRVAVLRAVEWWKANDAAFGLIGSAELGALRAPRDGFSRHGLTLVPLKLQWGVA